MSLYTLVSGLAFIVDSISVAKVVSASYLSVQDDLKQGDFKSLH